MDKIIIPGGTDWLGHRFDDFVVGDEHAVFKWCKIYLDQNPNATPPDFLNATTNAQKYRLTILGALGSNEPRALPHPTETDGDDDLLSYRTHQELIEAIRVAPKKILKGQPYEPHLTLWDDPVPYRSSNAVYQQLAEGIRTGRLASKPVYLDDQPGELDLTLCAISKDPVLDIAKRIGGYGKTITELLLAQHRSGSQSDRPLVEAAPAKKKRHAYKREKVEKAMRHDIDAGEITREGLEALLEKQLAFRYSVSRDTARKARTTVLTSGESIDSIPTNDK